MSFAWLPCLVVLLSPPQDNALAIVNHRATYGYLGAPRPKKGSLPGDAAYFTFQIKNLKLNENRKAFYSIAIEIRDAKGKLIYEQRPYNAVAQNLFGGDTLPCSAHVEIPLDAKPGPVNWKVTVQDRTTKQSVSVEGKGMILDPDFGIVRVGLFADSEGRTPMSAVAVVGDSAYLRLSTVGFKRDKETKQPDVLISMRILDENGKPTMAKPITGTINSGISAEERLLGIQLAVSMNRAGRFTLEVGAQDRVSGKRSQINYAIRVLPLE